MLETAVSPAMTKEAYKAETEPLRQRLSELQHDVKNSGLPVIVLFEGWAAAGKGSVLADVILTLDPRNFSAKSTLAPSAEELREPFLWRHWRSIPANGLFRIYDRAWYPEIASALAMGRISQEEAERRVRSVNLFERQMADDGALIVKFFLQVSKKEQKKRLDKLAAKKSTAWRVDADDYKQNRRYDKFYAAHNAMLEATNTEAAPWHVVPADDRRASLAHVYRVLVNALEAALAKRAAAAKRKPKKPTGPLASGSFTLLQMPELKELTLSQRLPDDEYRRRLKEGRQKLAALHNKIYLHKIPVVIAYEGWDAAGKGGNIRRLTSSLDPRGYEVVPIASPTPPEKARQYLWRFWRHLPKDGHIAIFDRSWYGRVLVERVEGFATEAEWRRAYREINEFEAELADWGAVILKYWLQIDPSEQLRRFKARQETPDKQWKLTDEDWRNREKWPQYEVAVNDMLRLTSTSHAPWSIIESQDKRFGRIQSIETLISAIERRL